MQHDKKQRGVVLFIALIALVVMSLAAVALIRSVDTNTIIAGNLTTKQSATISADSGLETALTWMTTTINPTALEVDNAAQGYYATQVTNPTAFNWDDSDSRPATGYGITAGTDGSGNAIRYIIQRMCRNTGAPAPGNCLFGAPVVGSSSQAVRDAPHAGANVTTDQSPMYRVTAKVTSAKNTVSYIQAFVY
ncbi:MAG: pilus assembly PilX N-terminal domain-containing protein [Methylotenera sp.]